MLGNTTLDQDRFVVDSAWAAPIGLTQTGPAGRELSVKYDWETITHCDAGCGLALLATPIQPMPAVDVSTNCVTNYAADRRTADIRDPNKRGTN